jgi:hypothetical protein
MVLSNHALLKVMHTPYETMLGHKCDFKVNYRFFTREQGGRVFLPIKEYVVIFGTLMVTMEKIKCS